MSTYLMDNKKDFENYFGNENIEIQGASFSMCDNSKSYENNYFTVSVYGSYKGGKYEYIDSVYLKPRSAKATFKMMCRKLTNLTTDEMDMLYDVLKGNDSDYWQYRIEEATKVALEGNISFERNWMGF